MDVEQATGAPLGIKPFLRYVGSVAGHRPVCPVARAGDGTAMRAS